MKQTEFKSETMVLPIVDLHPMFPRPKHTRGIRNYRKIVSSIREVGLIEPLAVVDLEGRYYIKDGNLRWQALKELGMTKVECLVSTDIDAYTYNKRVNPLSPVQAHAMIDRAVKQGADPDKIAATLNVSRDWVQRMEKLVEGISPKVVEKLKLRVLGRKFFDELKKVKPERQLEILYLVEATDDYSHEYMKALVLTTPIDKLVEKQLNRKVQRDQLQSELAGRLLAMEGEFRKATLSFRDNVFNLIKISAYTRQILRNKQVHEFLNRCYPDLLVEFEKVASDASLNV